MPWANLYYSEDYAENFMFLVDLYTAWGISPYADIINGAEPGEIYAFIYDPKVIWRITDYGNNAELIADFPPVYNFWRASIASSAQPGELFFLAIYWDGGPGGTIHIYHTTDYFQTYDLYVHNIGPNAVDQGNNLCAPSNIELQIFPNPANEAVNISCQTAITGSVELVAYNALGQQVWSKDMGVQPPGEYLCPYIANRLASGVYVLQLRTRKSNVTKIFTILK